MGLNFRTRSPKPHAPELYTHLSFESSKTHLFHLNENSKMSDKLNWHFTFFFIEFLLINGTIGIQNTQIINNLTIKRQLIGFISCKLSTFEQTK